MSSGVGYDIFKLLPIRDNNPNNGDDAMKNFRILFFIMVLFWGPGTVMGAEGVFLGWDKGEITTEQVGEAPADAHDRERVAKRSAMTEGVRYVVGEEVRSQSMVENLMLVYDKVSTKMTGFARNVKAVGSSYVKDGVFYQKYSMVVSPPDLDKALLESSIESRIDIPAVYETIDSPRIAMAVIETVVDESGRETVRDPDLHSESKIQEYFKKRNPDFYFLSMPALAGSVDDRPDWVALGKRNNFDVIIVGEIRTAFLLKIDKKVRGVGKDIVVPMHRYSSELTWNIINLSTSTRENTVHEVFDKGSPESGSGVVAAQKYAKDQVLKEAIPRLFTDLMLNWVQTVYYSPYEIQFQKTKAHEDNRIAGQLRQIKQIVPESVKSRGSMGGKLTYNLRVQGSLGEVAAALQKIFPTYEIAESRVGRVLLTPAGSKNMVFQLRVRNCSFMQSDDFFQILKGMPGVWEVNEPELADGSAVFTVTSSVALREMARSIEKKLPVRITTVKGSMIEAVTR